MHVCTAAVGEVGGAVTVRSGGLQAPARGKKPLQAHGAARMDAACADAHLAPKAEPKAVGEAAARIVEDTGRVHLCEECLRHRSVLREHDLRVARAVCGDVLHGGLEAVHDLGAECVVSVFNVEVFGCLETEGGGCARACQDFDACTLETIHKGLCSAIRRQVCVQEHGLHGVAGRWVVGLGVHEHAQGFVHVGCLVHKCVADPVRVSKHRDGGVLHHMLHQIRTAARNDKVNVVVELEQTGHLRAGLEEGHDGPVHFASRSAGYGVLDDLVQLAISVDCLTPALEQKPVASDNGEGGHLWQHVRARLEDDEQHADGYSLLGELQAVGELGAPEHAPQGVGLVGERADAVNDSLQLLGREV
mmetsp:Transcript_30393/g.81732  ORF Transcript_30393/g.81732 Transcript_30393/m.81732 type:complete len:361 (-) Transcript_30393:1208-2290(-)